MKNEFDSPDTILQITAHYVTPTGRDGKKEFTRYDATPDVSPVKEYHAWEARMEAKGYDINCLDTVHIETSTPFVPTALDEALASISLMIREDARQTPLEWAGNLQTMLAKAGFKIVEIA